MYDLALVSYVLALGHFFSEFTVYRTAGVVGVASPFIVASESSVTFFFSSTVETKTRY